MIVPAVTVFSVTDRQSGPTVTGPSVLTPEEADSLIKDPLSD